MDAVGQLKQRIEADFSITAVQHICNKGRNKLALMKSDGVSAGAGVIDNLDFFHDAFCSCSCSSFSFTKIRMAPAASLYSIIAGGENLSRTATGFNEILSY